MKSRFNSKSEFCLNCKKPAVQIVKLSDEEKESQTKCYVCTNPECTLRINLEEVKTWKKI